MPRTCGDTRIPVERIDRFVEVDTPVMEYVHDARRRRGRADRPLRRPAVDDGSTLQVGLGRVPNQMLAHLTNRHDLAIHSDVITEPVVDLVGAGVVTGPVVTSWAMGTRRLYDLRRRQPPFRVAADRRGLRPRGHRGPAAYGVGYAGVHHRPHRPGVHGQPRRRALRRRLDRPRFPSRGARRHRAASRSSASRRARRRAARRSASSSTRARRSRSRGPTCTG